MNKSKKIAFLGILLSFVIILQVFGSYIRVGTVSFSFVLIPIALGGIILGPLAGLFLGFAFSVAVTVMGIVGADAFTNVLLINAPLGTLITIFLKGLLAGFIPALIYKALSNNHPKTGVILSAVLTPVINTSVFIVCMLFISDVIAEQFITDGTTVIYFLAIGCAGINFIVELLINVILIPVLTGVSKAFGVKI